MNPYQQHYPQQGAGAPNGNPMYPNMHMQQQVPYQQPQQQQWYGQPQQHQPGQQYPQHPGQFPHSATPNNGGVPLPVPVHAKVRPAVDASSINDPFASLNIGLSSSGSGNASANNSRGNSFIQKPGSASGSFSNGQPHGAATTPSLQSQQNAFGGGFPPAQGGSRGNSFGAFTGALRADSLNKPASNASANPFDMF
uniref:Arf-GAP domain-containing protein n=1 Tax=Globisporangium ultimum (strain ATCC 200006 / CBS 805.95 / DAOM BR144) TaxID=431595 RepID=K3W7J4_GLOUD